MANGLSAGSADAEIGRHSLHDDLPARTNLDTVGTVEGDLSGTHPPKDMSPSGTGSAPSVSGTDTLHEVRIGAELRRNADGGIIGWTEVSFSGLTPTGMELRSGHTDGDTGHRQTAAAVTHRLRGVSEAIH